MTRTLYACECGDTHASILAAALCCDPAAPGDTD